MEDLDGLEPVWVVVLSGGTSEAVSWVDDGGR